MKKILFPTDFSSAAANAFEYAQKLAQQLGARVDVVYVFHIPIGDASNIPPEYVQKMLEEAELDASRELEAFVAAYKDTRSMGEVKPVYGLFKAVEITDIARRNHYDLIVMGCTRKPSIYQIAQESIPEKIARMSSKPFIMVNEAKGVKSLVKRWI